MHLVDEGEVLLDDREAMLPDRFMRAAREVAHLAMQQAVGDVHDPGRDVGKALTQFVDEIEADPGIVERDHELLRRRRAEVRCNDTNERRSDGAADAM